MRALGRRSPYVGSTMRACRQLWCICLTLYVAASGVPRDANAKTIVRLEGSDQAIYDSLSSPIADAGNYYHVRAGTRWTTELGTYEFLEGTLSFFEPVGGQPSGCLFRGEANFHFAPGDPTERQQLKRYCGDSILSVPCKSAYFRFFDTTIVNGLLRCVDGSAEKHLPRAKDLKQFEKRAGQDLVIDLAVRGWMLHNAREPKAPFLYAAPVLEGQRRLHFLLDETADETITLWREPSGAHPSGVVDLVCSYDRVRTEVETRRRPTLIRGGFDVARYNSDVTIHQSTEMELDVRLSAAVRRSDLEYWEFYCAPDLKIDTLWIDDALAPFVYSDKGAWLVARALHRHDTKDTVEIRFQYRSRDLLEKYPWGDFIVRHTTRWLPVGTPHRRAKYTTTFRFPRHYDLISSGEQILDSIDGDWRVQRWRTYGEAAFISFNYGSFDRLETSLDNGLRLDIYRSRNHRRGLLSGDIKKDVAADIAGALKLFSDLLVPYPWDHLAATEIPGEHGQGFPQLLHLGWYSFDRNKKGVTDAFRAHEVAHQWFGHMVGWASYRDQWLSEGFAEYAGALFVQNRYEGDQEFTNLIKEWRKRILETGGHGFWHDGPGTAPISLGFRCSSVASPASYTQLVYAKGAYVLHMLRQMMHDYETGSDERFFAMLHDYVTRLSGTDATTYDFQRVAESHIDVPLQWFFDQWVYGTQVPRYEYSWWRRETSEGRWVVEARIDQLDVDSSFLVFMPVTFVFEDSRRTILQTVKGPKTEFTSLPFDSKPREVIFNDHYAILCREKVVKHP